MFGFLKRMLGGDKATTTAAGQPVLEIRAGDLDDPARLGPKLAAYAAQRPDVSGAEYDPAIEAVRIRYASGGEGTMFLSNALPFLRQAAGGRAMAEYLDNSLAEPAAAPDGYLLPVLKPAGYVEEVMAQLRAAGAPADQAVPFWYQQLNLGLVVMLVRDTPERMVSVSAEDLAQAGLDEEAARRQAMEDLFRFSDDHELRIESREQDPLKQLRLDGNYDASTFFMSGLWDSLSDGMTGRPAALFAARNLVLYGDSGDAATMAQLERLARPGGAALPYAIAPHQILIWTPEGWDTHHPAPEPQGQPH